MYKLAYTTRKVDDYGIVIKMLPNKVVLQHPKMLDSVEYTLQQYGRDYKYEAMRCVEHWKKHFNQRFVD